MINMITLNETVAENVTHACQPGIVLFPDVDKGENKIVFGKLEKIIETNIHNQSFDFDNFAKLMNMSKSTLHRKVSEISGLSPCKLINQERISRAMILLKEDDLNISEIAYQVGFNDAKYFSRCFKSQTGMIPKEYRDQFKQMKVESGNKKKFFVKAVERIEKKISEPDYDIDQFALDLCVSKSTLYRKLRDDIGLSPNELIRSVRIKSSTRLFTKGVNIQDIAFAVGFYDSKYFSRCFKKEVGITPTQYRMRITGS
jgi:AraC-like DNA-binding protein